MSSITNIRANAAFATFAERSARWHMQMLEILQSASDSGCVAMNQLPTQHCHVRHRRLQPTQGRCTNADPHGAHATHPQLSGRGVERNAQRAIDGHFNVVHLWECWNVKHLVSEHLE